MTITLTGKYPWFAAKLAKYLGASIGAPSITMGAGTFIYESSTDTITANAGGGQANATPITSQTVRVTVVATAGDSVRLPVSVPGLEVLVINHGANPMQVYGAGTDLIDDIATGTGVSQMVNSMVIYSCATAGNWYTNGIATGYGGPGLQTSSYVNGLVAFAGGGQASGTLVTAMLNRFVTVATAADSGKLMTAVPGLVITVTNAAAANSMNLFPASGDQINALGANAAFAIAAGKTATFSSVVAGQWHAILSA